MNKLELTQLKRANWISLLEKDMIDEAVLDFQNYLEKIKKIGKEKDLKKESNNEIKKSKEIFCEKVLSKAEVFLKDKNYINAIKYYQCVFEIDNKNIKNLKDYITSLQNLKQYDLELIVAKHLVEVDSSFDNYKILSKAYEHIKDYKKAILLYKKYIKLSGKIEFDAADHAQLGCFYFDSYNQITKKPEEIARAVSHFMKALEASPKSKTYLKNLIFAAMKIKNSELEIKTWKTYFECGYANKEDEFTYSMLCMRNGKIDEWEKYYDARFYKDKKPTSYPKLEQPQWRGENLKDKTLLVHFEQGFGDTFLAWGYAPRLAKIARHVIFITQDSTVKLLENKNFGIEIIKKPDDYKKLNFDYHIPALSVPAALKLDKTNISVGEGYIKANKNLVEKFKKQYFDTPLYKIGIAFLGNSIGNKERNIPSGKLICFDNLKNVQFYCLSKDVSDKQLEEFKNNKIINIAKTFDDFSQTAAAIENLDLVVSSDNCILNLAGAMGKKTFGLFSYNYEYRWYDLNNKDCGWYTSVKPFVNDEYEDWGKTIKNVIKEIEKIIK